MCHHVRFPRLGSRHGGCVVAPGQRACIEFVAEGRKIKTRRDGLAVCTSAGERRDRRAVEGVTSPRASGRRVRRRAGLSGDQVQMRRETLVDVALEHAIGQNVLRRHVPVRLRLGARHEAVCRILRQARRDVRSVRRSDGAQIPAIHLAAVVRMDEVGGIVADVVVDFKRRRLKPDARAVVGVAEGHRVGARKTRKEIVGRAVLLHDDDDVFDVRVHAAFKDGLLPTRKDEGQCNEHRQDERPPERPARETVFIQSPSRRRSSRSHTTGYGRQ